MFADEVPSPSKRRKGYTSPSPPDSPTKKMLLYPKFFMKNRRTGQYQCVICEHRPYETLSRAIAHEASVGHTEKLRYIDRGGEEHCPSSPALMDSEVFEEETAELHVPAEVEGRQAAGSVGSAGGEQSHLFAKSHDVNAGGYAYGTVHGPALLQDLPDQIYDNWAGSLADLRDETDDEDDGAYNDGTPTPWSDSEMDDVTASVAEYYGGVVELLSDSNDESEGEEGSQEAVGQKAGNPASPRPEAVLPDGVEMGADLLLGHDNMRLDGGDDPDPTAVLDDADKWWPWPSKEACLLDVTGAFPRALFSESELAAARWLASKLGAQQLPTIRQVKLARKCVMNVVGLNPQTFESSQHNLYTVEEFERIIKHEFANPIVRRVLSTYAQVPTDRFNDTRQARKWLEDVDANLAGPMARAADGKDYYVHELALARIAGGTVPVMIARWYEKGKELFAKAHPVRVTQARDAYVVDGRVERVLEVPLESFVLSVQELASREVQRAYGLPPPDKVLGTMRTNDVRTPPEPWSHPMLNEWRVRARGRRVHAAPIWLYCDDTSGNTSKKWNKHNSILFVLGGLPQSEVQRLYNIHFLSTSNIASPLEMMERVSAMLREARTNGISVWDCLTGEEALVVPWVHAFQGDNPMASEFSSHIGMTGKCICRICEVYRKVQGVEKLTGAAGEARRIDEFMTAGKPRTKETTLDDLRKQERRAFGGAPSAVSDMATDTGTKDKYFQYFVDELQQKLNHIREKHGKPRRTPAEQDVTTAGTEEVTATGQEDDMSSSSSSGESSCESGEDDTGESVPWKTRLAQKLQEIRDEMPKNIFSPVLDIPDFDAHADTPIEILHVVLLGVVKYFWRDACARQAPEGKTVLKARLTSMNVDGLGISPIRGHTLVYYAKSLVGRDFRVILQVAPAVLHGLIPDNAYEAWLALCRLAPLVFLNEIEDLKTYTQRLKTAIDDFLNATALWSTQWFNKPKFHLFVHLIDHILRFGPAALYSTEAFESYNFVIRLRSINSNKHAPSSDIAHSFSHLHAVRHLVSGGFVTVDEDGNAVAPRQAGEGVRELLKDGELRELMCINNLSDDIKAGTYVPIKIAEGGHCVGTETKTYATDPTALLPAHVTKCKSVVLQNNDQATVGGHVIYCQRTAPSTGSGSAPTLLVGQVDEIIADTHSGDMLGLLVSACTIGEVVIPYRMPACRLAEPRHTLFLQLEDIKASVNTYHNCAKYRCKLTRTRKQMQERTLTAKKDLERVHKKHPEDRILNMGQLRSASALLTFYDSAARYPNPAMTRAQVIDQAMKNRAELDLEAARKKLDAQQKKATRTANRQGTQTATAGPAADATTSEPSTPVVEAVRNLPNIPESPLSPSEPRPTTPLTTTRRSRRPRASRAAQDASGIQPRAGPSTSEPQYQPLSPSRPMPADPAYAHGHPAGAHLNTYVQAAAAINGRGAVGYGQTLMSHTALLRPAHASYPATPTLSNPPTWAYTLPAQSYAASQPGNVHRQTQYPHPALWTPTVEHPQDAVYSPRTIATPSSDSSHDFMAAAAGAGTPILQNSNELEAEGYEAMYRQYM